MKPIPNYRMAGLLGLVFALISAPLRADTIILKNGKEIFGRLKNQSMLDVVMLVGGKEQVYSKKRIRSIRFGETKEEKALYEKLKRMSEELSNNGEMDLTRKKAELDRLQRELASLFKEQESRRKVAEALDEEFRKILEKERSGPNGLLRQAAFPGWGHYYMDQGEKAIFWSSLFAGFGVYALSSHQAMTKQKREYEAALQRTTLIGGQGVISPALLHYTHVEGLYQDYSKRTVQNNQAARLLLGVYVASLAHLSWDNWIGKLFHSRIHGRADGGGVEYSLLMEPGRVETGSDGIAYLAASWKF